MRVGFLTRTLEAGGAERQLVLLARGLARRGVACVIFTFYGGAAAIPGVAVVPLGKHGRWDTVPFFVRLRRAVRRHDVDVLHAYLPVANTLGWLLRLTLPRLRLVLGIRSSAMELRRYDFLTRLSWRLEALGAPLADLVIVNSYGGREDALWRGLPASRLIVIPNGVDTSAFRRDAAAGDRFRRKFGIAEDEILVGVIGRADPMKDHATFRAAFRTAAGRVPRLRAVLVGTAGGDDDAGILRLAWQSDMRAVYSGLDMLCLSSAYGEGVPNAVAEAMACETPCVATDVGDTARLIGATGTLVPPIDAAALGAALVAMAELPAAARRELGRAARQRIEAEFGMERLVDETLRAFAAAGIGRSAGPSRQRA